jgi:hypothetical protein
MRKSFEFIDIPWSLSLKENPPSDRSARIGFTYKNTQIEFLLVAGLLNDDAPVRTMPRNEARVSTDDLTDEGYDFLMSKAMWKWLGTVERRSNDLGRQGGTFEEQLKIYADGSGLYRRLEKFRKERAAKAN